MGVKDFCFVNFLFHWVFKIDFVDAALLFP